MNIALATLIPFARQLSRACDQGCGTEQKCVSFKGWRATHVVTPNRSPAAATRNAIDCGCGRGNTTGMEELLRWLAAIFTIVPGLLIAARLPTQIVGWAFVGLTVGSLVWIVVAISSRDHALLAQNIAIAVINTFGIYRWLVWKEKPK